MSVLINFSYRYVVFCKLYVQCSLNPTANLYSVIKVWGGLHSSAVDWGTAVQAGRPWVQFPMGSLGFFIDLMLATTQCLWGST